MALALPELVEQEHWGNPSFRNRGRIFATVADEQHVNVMIDPFDVEPVVRDDPGSFEELMWGKQLAGVRVSLKQAAPDYGQVAPGVGLAPQGSQALAGLTRAGSVHRSL